ncbi:gp53-like domain-containing protein [Rhizobium tumorigenes]|uniref:Putative tail fiber protein gp53-like C-terminal domain-containing protein n=1 Tax=Rhizobium tumorigenes TaxID=2041385 RepID=A0AAF1KUR8_9HYPH|nr:hypothetical protein [Rhizobium tumorigenes]WFR98725.1 hypothetical protein PR017_23785 [Rhizobium tumorigenes]
MSRTTIRMRVLPRFPARISGTNGIKSVRAGADLIVKNDFSDLIRIPGVDNQAKTFFLSWNADLDLYSILSFTDLFSAIPGVTGFMTAPVYDPQGRRSDVFAGIPAGGISSFATTILDDANGAAAWATLGALSSKGVNGYTKEPDGTITQYGKATGVGNDFSVVLPVVFPNAFRSVTLTPEGVTLTGIPTSALAFAADIATLGAFNVRPRFITNGGTVGVATQNVFWKAIGY